MSYALEIDYCLIQLDVGLPGKSDSKSKRMFLQLFESSCGDQGVRANITTASAKNYSDIRELLIIIQPN